MLQRCNGTTAGLALADDDISFITAIVSREGGLVIGAPSSPVLSNALMFRFDEYWSQKCSAIDVTYSRYADDLYFSTNSPNVLSQVFSMLQNYVSHQSSPRLQINTPRSRWHTSSSKRSPGSGIRRSTTTPSRTT